jgi:hypothetical protein
LETAAQADFGELADRDEFGKPRKGQQEAKGRAGNAIARFEGADSNVREAAKMG